MVPWPVTAVACVVSVSLGWALGAWMMVASGSAGASGGTESRKILARPQSMTSTSPNAPIMTLAGFRSRWSTPRAWAESHRVANAEEETQTVRERMDGLDVLVEALAFDKLHGVEDTAIGERTDGMNGDDAGMLEASEDAGRQVETEREVAGGGGDGEDRRSRAGR